MGRCLLNVVHSYLYSNLFFLHQFLNIAEFYCFWAEILFDMSEYISAQEDSNLSKSYIIPYSIYNL